MISTISTERLALAVEQLLILACDGQREQAKHLAARQRQRRLRVLVAGEAKRGKSTLVNRLVGRDVLPYGVLPVTAIATTVRVEHGGDERLEVHYTEGRTERRAVADLTDLVTERGNPGNRRAVAGVDVILSTGDLGGYPVELVDTPGTGSIFEHNTRAAHEAYTSLDAVIVVLTADPPITSADRAILIELSAAAVQTFVIVNKADRLSAHELADATRFTESVCADAGLNGPIWAMSARDRDDGLLGFQHAFEIYLASRGADDTTRALAGHASRLANRMRDEALVTLRAAELAAAAGRDQVDRFSDRITDLTHRTHELGDLCSTTRARLLRILGDSAAALIAELTPRARERAKTTFTALERSGDAGEAEAAARQAAIDETITGVDVWRATQGAALERGLRELIERLNADVHHQLDDLRDAAEKLLGVHLAGSVDPVALHTGRGFWYQTEPAPVWELPGTELLRRHGPAAMKRARSRVLNEVEELVDRQVGRARADLQQRLSDTLLGLTSQLRSSHGDLFTQLRAALDNAAVLADAGDLRTGQQREALTERLRKIDALITNLGTEGERHPPTHRGASLDPVGERQED